jgi:acetyl-CoA synthetase
VTDAGSKVVITTDEGKRGGKLIGTKKIVDDALKQCPDVSHVLVYKRTGSEIPWTEGRDYWWHEEVEKWPAYISPEPVNSEDPLFLLYTSGSTGKPKGVLHSTGGYLLGCAMTGKYVFDIHPGDRYFCGGDVGWITGHSYVVYAPLLLGVTTVVFEGTPAYPNFSRYWDIIEKHKVTQFYVAPTALRLLKRAGDEHVKAQMKDLRVLGSVGEPIAAEIWKWYFEVVGHEEAHVVDVSSRRSMSTWVIPVLTSVERPTGKQRPDLTSSALWVVSHLLSLVALLYLSLVLSPPSSTLFPERRSTATMLRAFSHSSSHGLAWPALCMVPTSDIWIPT